MAEEIEEADGGTLETGAVALGAFDPPHDYQFEPELVGPAPRPIPPVLREGRYARRRWLTVYGLLEAGLLCVGLGFFPIIKVWGQFFLPLAYIAWIGVALIAAAAIIPIWALVRKGPYQYVAEGIPLVARIRALAKVPAAIVNGQVTGHRFLAEIDYRDPVLNDIRIAQVQSRDLSGITSEGLTTTYHVGDYVTAVYLPREREKTLQLYGFLELRPELGIVRREGRGGTGLWETLLTIVAGFSFFFVLCWNVYAYSRYSPIEMNREHAIPFAAGAVVLGVGMIALMAYANRRVRLKREERNFEAVARGEAIELPPDEKQGWFGSHGLLTGALVVFGSLLLGGLTATTWAYTANALFADSPPTFKVVRLTEVIETTHSMIFREYTLKYQFVGEDETHRFGSSPAHIDMFQVPLAVAEIHDGWLGWPWVKDIMPPKVLDADVEAAPEGVEE